MKENQVVNFIKEHKMSFFVVVSAIVMLIGLTYAWLQLTLRGEKDVVLQAGTLKLNLDDSMNDEITMTDVVPISDKEGLASTGYTFTLENTGTVDASYEIYLDDLTLSDTDTRMNDSFIKYQLTRDGEEMGYDLLNTIGENPKRLLDKGEISPKEKYTYNLKLWIASTATNEAMGTIFKGQLRIEGVQGENKSLYKKIAREAVLDSQKSKFVASSTGVNFKQVSSDTNGRGTYTLTSTKDSEYPIHYYRGAVTNNNLKFAGFCWKIVRTTETGGIKIIYNGSPDESGYCTNITGESTQIGTSAFNAISNSKQFVGYMVNDTTRSTIKAAVDTWYQNNMTDYTEKLEDTIWCNDRTFRADGSNISFGPRDRIYVSKGPSLSCSDVDDRFTVDVKNGNGLLTYPIALLTADEFMLAGGKWGTANSDYYLYTNQNCWTLSPCYFHGTALVLFISVYGYLGDNSVSNSHGIRPSVSLISSTKIISGNGTTTNPYVVE